jgi:hypothetical protein
MPALEPAAGAPDVEIVIVEAMDVAIAPAVPVVASLVVTRLRRRRAGEPGGERSGDENTSEFVHLNPLANRPPDDRRNERGSGRHVLQRVIGRLHSAHPRRFVLYCGEWWIISGEIATIYITPM